MTDQPTSLDTCGVCGNAPVVYRNYQEQPFCAHCANCACGKVPCTKPEPDGLRERYAAAIRPNMLMGLQDAELDGPGGTQRINEWVDWIAKELATVRDRELEQLRADLDRVQQAACRTAESLRTAKARVADLEAERERDAAITAQIDAQTEEQINGATEVAQYYKALAERTQAWGEQHQDRANRYRARTDAVKAECDALNSETKGLNPFAMAGRRDAVARIRAALQTISYDTPVPDDPRVTALEAENARLRTAWTSARGRVKRAKRNRDGELRWANNMWSDALRDLHRYRQAWKSARHRATMYLQSNENFSASLHSNNAAYLQLAARAEKAAREHGRAEILRAAAEHNAKDQADRRRTAEAAVESVRDLHQRWNADPGSCAHCDDGYGTPLSYPCPTIRSLDPQQQPTTTEAIPMTDRERLLQESALDLRAEIRELRTYAGQAADLIESGRTRDLAQALSLLRSIAHMPPQPTTTEASR